MREKSIFLKIVRQTGDFKAYLDNFAKIGGETDGFPFSAFSRWAVDHGENPSPWSLRMAPFPDGRVTDVEKSLYFRRGPSRKTVLPYDSEKRWEKFSLHQMGKRFANRCSTRENFFPVIFLTLAMATGKNRFC